MVTAEIISACRPAIAAARNLVQAAKGKPATGQMLIQRRKAKWQNRPRTQRATFQPLDALAKLGDNRVYGVVWHGTRGSEGLSIRENGLYVHYMFRINI
jgi:hypothetical protein